MEGEEKDKFYEGIICRLEARDRKSKKSGGGDSIRCTMNVVSYNIRGCGNSVKIKRIRQLLQKGGVDMCFIQESKMSQVAEGLITSIWGSVDCDWSAKEAEGRTGGIITIWKKGSSKWCSLLKEDAS